MLGAGIQGERLPPLMDLRMQQAFEFLCERPNAKAIVSGGQGRGESITEAEAMKRIYCNAALMNHGSSRKKKRLTLMKTLKTAR